MTDCRSERKTVTVLPTRKITPSQFGRFLGELKTLAKCPCPCPRPSPPGPPTPPPPPRPCTTLCPAPSCPPSVPLGRPTILVSPDIDAPCVLGIVAVFSTIQTAVNAAAPGDVIAICPGTYVEQVSIVGPGKNNITLQPVTPGTVIVQAPAVMASPGAIILVNGAQGVNILRLRIQGPGAIQNQLNFGIFVIGGGSATIDSNVITAIRDNPVTGLQHGTGIRVGRFVTGDVGSAIITNNTITDYQKNGITIDNTGTTVLAQCNIIIGLGPTHIIANNGIQVSRGALAQVLNNTVIGNYYTGNPANGTAAGILLFGLSTPGVLVQGNMLRGNYDSIVLFGGLEGDIVRDSIGSTITCNTITGSINIGIHVELEDGSGAVVADNTISFNTVTSSGFLDLADDTIGDLSCCTTNIWACNKATSDSRGGCLVASTSAVPPTPCPGTFTETPLFPSPEDAL